MCMLIRIHTHDMQQETFGYLSLVEFNLIKFDFKFKFDFDFDFFFPF